MQRKTKSLPPTFTIPGIHNVPKFSCGNKQVRFTLLQKYVTNWQD